MDTKKRYKLTDKQRQFRLAELSQEPLNLENEIAVARLLLEEALQDKNPNLANALLATIGKLTAQHIADEIRLQHLMSSAELRQQARLVIECIFRHLTGIPGHEDLAERIVQDITSIPQLRLGGPNDSVCD